MAKQIKVLIVEDAREWATLIKKLISQFAEIKSTIAYSPENALKAVNTENYNLLICDLKLEYAHGCSSVDHTGINVLSYVNQNAPNTNIIVLTGFAEEYVQEISRLNIDKIIQKENFEKDNFLRIIRNYIENFTPKEAKRKVEKSVTLKKETENEYILKNIVEGFLHNLGSQIGLARISIQRLHEQTSDKSKKSLDELKRLSMSIEKVRHLSERLRNVIGREPIVFKLVNLNQLINEVILQIDNFKSNKIVLKLAGELPEIEGDRELLWQLLENLIINALESLEDEKGIVKISTSFSRELHVVNVKISDNGCSISKENIPHIYKISYSTKPSGLGLGLYLAKRCVDVHNGKIDCQSEIGKGTTFNVTLPIKRKQ